jgi:SAM-dependent methyltransferase
MTDDEDLLASYGRVADEYVARIAGELAHKPLDRELLDRFADRVRGKGRVYDLGCGPGHVGAYLHERGALVTGIDLSPAMVERASRRYPAITFAVGDMRALSAIPDRSALGVVAFYAIVHLAPGALVPVFAELARILAPGAPALLAFHIGTGTVHLDEWWGHRVTVDFYFHEPDEVAAGLRAAGLTVTDITERDPYPDVEYPSRRCYLVGEQPAGRP